MIKEEEKDEEREKTKERKRKKIKKYETSYKGKNLLIKKMVRNEAKR